MKLRNLAVLLALIIGFGAVAHAETVTVTSFTATTAGLAATYPTGMPTTIAAGASGRKHLVVFNNSANNLYYSMYPASATVTAGMILPSSTTVTLPDFNGTLYGQAPAGSASINVRYGQVRR